MDLLTIRELYKDQGKYLDQEITIGGWVRSIRDSKTFGFIVVNDGTYFQPLQVVYSEHPHRIIRCRRSVTALSTCVPSAT